MAIADFSDVWICCWDADFVDIRLQAIERSNQTSVHYYWYTTSRRGGEPPHSDFGALGKRKRIVNVITR